MSDVFPIALLFRHASDDQGACFNLQARNRLAMDDIVSPVDPDDHMINGFGGDRD
ncbi:hypothetical protein D3C85_1364870 [compost metagenome]